MMNGIHSKAASHYPPVQITAQPLLLTAGDVTSIVRPIAIVLRYRTGLFTSSKIGMRPLHRYLTSDLNDKDRHSIAVKSYPSRIRYRLINDFVVSSLYLDPRSMISITPLTIFINERSFWKNGTLALHNYYAIIAQRLVRGYEGHLVTIGSVGDL